jgi:hypothetical protein
MKVKGLWTISLLCERVVAGAGDDELKRRFWANPAALLSLRQEDDLKTRAPRVAPAPLFDVGCQSRTSLR